MLQHLLNSKLLKLFSFKNSNYIINFSLLLFVSCNSSVEQDKEIAKRVFTYNQPNSVTSLDPAFARSMTNIWAIDHLYNGLIQLDDSLNIKDCIAKSWSIDPSGKIYTFILRSDVVFRIVKFSK